MLNVADLIVPPEIWDKHILTELDPISLRVFMCVGHLFYELGNQHLVNLVEENKDVKFTVFVGGFDSSLQVQLFDLQIMSTVNSKLPNSVKVASFRKYLNSKKVKNAHLLHYFADKTSIHERKIFDLLIHLGMDPNLILHHDQPTALHYALTWSIDFTPTEQRVAIGMKLIEAGADTRVKNLDDKTIFAALREWSGASKDHLNEDQISRLEKYANAQMIRTGLHKKTIPKIDEVAKEVILQNRMYSQDKVPFQSCLYNIQF